MNEDSFTAQYTWSLNLYEGNDATLMSRSNLHKGKVVHKTTITRRILKQNWHLQDSVKNMIKSLFFFFLFGYTNSRRHHCLHNESLFNPCSRWRVAITWNQLLVAVQCALTSTQGRSSTWSVSRWTWWQVRSRRRWRSPVRHQAHAETLRACSAELPTLQRHAITTDGLATKAKEITWSHLERFATHAGLSSRSPPPATR